MAGLSGLAAREAKRDVELVKSVIAAYPPLAIGEFFLRSATVRGLSGWIPLYIVNEYPRCGGSWISFMLSAALNVPLAGDGRLFKLKPSVLHAHHLSPRGLRNVVVVWRDGRDVMVSWYHMCCFVEQFPFGPKIRSELPFRDYENVEKNMPAFLEYTFANAKTIYPFFSWVEFVRRWHCRRDAVHVRYEDLLRDPTGELRRLLDELVGVSLDERSASSITERHSFRNLSGRSPGVEAKSSFLRKGVVGDWRDVFSDQARAVFEKHAGSELALLGYGDG